jgi:hypothetical protein
MEVQLMTTVAIPAGRPLVRIGAALRAVPVPRALVWPGAVVLAALVELGANALGLWWVTVLIGIAAGAVRARRRILGLLAATALGWAVGIVLSSGSETFQIGGEVTAEVFNARAIGWSLIIIAVLYAFLLALAGAWVGAAARRLAPVRGGRTGAHAAATAATASATGTDTGTAVDSAAPAAPVTATTLQKENPNA